MRKIAYCLSIGFAGCEEEGTIEVADDATDAEIDLMVDEMANEHASSWEGDERLGWHSDMTDEERDEETTSFYEGVDGTWQDAPPEEWDA